MKQGRIIIFKSASIQYLRILNILSSSTTPSLLYNSNPIPRYNASPKKLAHCAVPERVRVHIWITYHHRLCTRAITSRWNNGDGNCDICHDAIEDQLHALRDCPVASMVWKKLVPSRKRQSFFRTNWSEWISQNLQCKGRHKEDVQWPEIFPISCWHIWRWRNQFLHDDEFMYPWNPGELIKQYLQSFQNRDNFTEPKETRTEVILVHWNPPPAGWCKLNTDDMVTEGGAGCGGVIRGDCGEWLSGYSVKLEEKSIKMAEVWGIYEGLQLFWALRFKRVEVECDAQLVVDEIQKQRLRTDCFLL